MKARLGLCPWASALLLMLVLKNYRSVSFILTYEQFRLIRHSRCGQFPCPQRSASRAGWAARTSGTKPSFRCRHSHRMLDRGSAHSVSAPHSVFKSAQQTTPLRTAMATVLPFGRLVGVHLPEEMTEDVLKAARAELMPEEVSYCLGLHPAMQLEFLGGRLAIRRALCMGETSGSCGSAAADRRTVSVGSETCGAILHNDSGAPLLPDGLSASISHKRHIAVALVQQPGACGHLGVDIELPAVRRRVDLRRRVLTEKECDGLGCVSGLPEEEDVLLRFSMKEAVYKAAHPLLRRTLGFKDVEVQPNMDGSCHVSTTTPGAWGNLSLSAGWVRMPDVLGQPLLLTYCRAVAAPEQ